MNIKEIEKLREVLRNMQCKNCIFSKTCDFLVDNYKKDICQIIEGGK